MADSGDGSARAWAAIGARALGDAGRELTSQRFGLGAEIETASAGQPWGDGTAGAGFERRYRLVEQHILDAWTQLAAYVESLGEAAERSTGERP
jgi:hypothetical protein